VVNVVERDRHVFPPKRTSDPQEMLHNMWASITRGGEVFTQDARCIPKNDSFECVFYLAPDGVSKDARVPLTKYMRRYAQASGWKMQTPRFTKRYVVFEIASSRAASSFSRKS